MSTSGARPGPIRVAVDAMGGDFAPAEVVKGAVKAAQQLGVHVLLVGDQEVVSEELAKAGGPRPNVTVVPSQGKITEDEHPALALRQKPRASVVVATQLVKTAQADAVVSMGSTGATMASAALVLGMFPGLERPALGGPFLGLVPKVTMLDLGSNVDAKPAAMLSFAILGTSFSRIYLGIERPRVAIMSVGAEEAKGNRLVHETQPLLKRSGLNFVGNVEGFDLFTGRADVIVCDGFVGNVVMKFAEGMGAAIIHVLKQKLARALPPAEAEALVTQLYDMTNLVKKTGGPLFGVNGPVIIGHGASYADGVAGAINTARQFVELDLVRRMKEDLASTLASMDIRPG